MNHKSFLALASALSLSFFSVFAQMAPPDVAVVCLTNEGRVPVVVEGAELRPGASVRVKVPAQAAGTVKVSAPSGCSLERAPDYPALESGALYSMRIVVRKDVETAASEVGNRKLEVERTAKSRQNPSTPQPSDPSTGGEAAAPSPAPDDAMRKPLLDFRLRFSDNPTNTLAQFAHMSPSQAQERFERMTCRMPGEFHGVFRDFVRRTMPWVGRLSDGQSMACLYNLWCDGAILFPVRQEGDSFAILASPSIVAGEFLRGEDLTAAGMMPEGENLSGMLASRVTLAHAGFLRMAKNGEWPMGRFETWDAASRQSHLKTVFSRLGALAREQAGVMLLESRKKPGAVRYGAFLEALGKKADASAVLAAGAATTWRDLPEDFRGSLWPVRAIPGTDGVLTIWQSVTFPEMVLFIGFRDGSEEDATWISLICLE